mmetsp:Transcript_9790/g.19935  ORF Transcript_9790/g.19935 Transcript_9790/m.19935 type:complete len:213 (-) Transcript_9790:166-804(-)
MEEEWESCMRLVRAQEPDGDWEKLYTKGDFDKDPDSMRVWRRPGSNGLYEYQVLGTAPFSAAVITGVVNDLEYHKEWDSHCKALHIIEKQSGSESIYWEVSYPWPLSSRDYVYRRTSIKRADEDGLQCFLSKSEACDHPSMPETKKSIRVVTFSSTYLFRPRSEDSCEFVYQFHEDPRGAIPKTVVNWFVSRALPGFMDNLYDACSKRKVTT